MTLATAHPTSPSATAAHELRDTPREPLLVALKTYDGCDAALSVAQWLAGTQHRPLHAITVLEPHEMAAVIAGVPALPEPYRAEERATITNLIESRLSRTQWGRGATQRVDVVEGPAVQTVTDVALERTAHAIVVGTGQHGALGRLVYGERAVQIARLSDRPVVVVPPSGIQPSGLAVTLGRSPRWLPWGFYTPCSCPSGLRCPPALAKPSPLHWPTA